MNVSQFVWAAEAHQQKLAVEIIFGFAASFQKKSVGYFKAASLQLTVALF